MIKKIIHELISGWKSYELLFLLIFLTIQVYLYVNAPDSIVGMIAGIAGIINVVFISKGKISNYLFGLIFAYAYFFSSLEAKFYGEMTTALFIYIPAQFIGFFMWLNKQQSIQGSEVVIAKKMNLYQIIGWTIAIIIASIVYVSYLRTTDGNSVTLDGVTTILVVVAQILMLLRYREQWVLWIIINILTIILWSDNASLTVMNIGFLINSLYGFWNWTKLEKEARIHRN